MDDRNICPRCKKPTPPAEMTAYHRCEDCWVGRTPDTGGSPQLFHRHRPTTQDGQRVTRGKTPY